MKGGRVKLRGSPLDRWNLESVCLSPIQIFWVNQKAAFINTTTCFISKRQTSHENSSSERQKSQANSISFHVLNINLSDQQMPIWCFSLSIHPQQLCISLFLFRYQKCLPGLIFFLFASRGNDGMLESAASWCSLFYYLTHVELSSWTEVYIKWKISVIKLQLMWYTSAFSYVLDVNY